MTSRTDLRPVRRIARTLVLAAALPIVAAPRAPADTIDLVFRPPEMAPQEVCMRRREPLRTCLPVGSFGFGYGYLLDGSRQARVLLHRQVLLASPLSLLLEGRNFAAERQDLFSCDRQTWWRSYHRLWTPWTVSDS